MHFNCETKSFLDEDYLAANFLIHILRHATDIKPKSRAYGFT
jgi:hypothetical protein